MSSSGQKDELPAASHQPVTTVDLTTQQLIGRMVEVLAKQEKTMKDLNTKLKVLASMRAGKSLTVLDRSMTLSTTTTLRGGASTNEGGAPVLVKLPFLSEDGSGRTTSPPSAARSPSTAGAAQPPAVGSSLPPEPPIVVRPAVHKVRPLMRATSQDDVLSSTTESSATPAPLATKSNSNVKGGERRGSAAGSPGGRRSVPLSARGPVAVKKLKQTQVATAVRSAILTSTHAGAVAPGARENSGTSQPIKGATVVKGGSVTRVVPRAKPAASTPINSTPPQPALIRSNTAPRVGSIRRSVDKGDGASPEGPRRVSSGPTTSQQAKVATRSKAPAANQRPSTVSAVPAKAPSTRHPHSGDWDLSQRMKELEDIQATNTQALERTHSAPYARTHSMKSRTAESSPSRPGQGSKLMGPQFATLEDMEAASTPAADDNGSGGDAQEPAPLSRSRRASTTGSNASGSSRRLTALRLATKSPRVRGFGERLGMAYVAYQQRQTADERTEGSAADGEARSGVEPRRRVVVHDDPMRGVPAVYNMRAVGFSSNPPAKATNGSNKTSTVVSQTTSPLPPPRGAAPVRRTASSSVVRPPWSTTTKVASAADPQSLSRSERRDAVEARNIVQVKKGYRKPQ